MQRINLEQIKDIANLYDIKTLAQTDKDINKGWACISQEKTLAKSSYPTLYADIKDKYDNADFITTFTQKVSNKGKSGVAYYNGYYYFCGAIDGNKLYKTQDFTTITEVATISEEPYNVIIVNDKVVMLGWNYLQVYDITNEILSSATSLTNRGADCYVIDDKICWREGQTYNWSYITITDLENVHNVDLSTAKFPIFKLGTTYYAIEGDTIYSGNSFDTITTSVTTLGNFNGFAKNTSLSYFIFCANQNTLTTYNFDGSSLTVISTNTLNDATYIKDKEHLNDNGTIYLSVSYWGSNWVSSDNGLTYSIKTIGGGTNGFDYYKANNKVFAIVNYNDGAIYEGGSIELISYTDTINGTTITYYKHSSSNTKIITSPVSADITAVKNYLGYFNYFVLNTTNEQVTLPYNSNLWTMMYVGDNYIETSFPSGNLSKKVNILYGTSAPTTAIIGTIGDIYIDTTNVAVYICAGISGSTYTWKQITLVA